MYPSHTQSTKSCNHGNWVRYHGLHIISFVLGRISAKLSLRRFSCSIGGGGNISELVIGPVMTTGLLTRTFISDTPIRDDKVTPGLFTCGVYDTLEAPWLAMEIFPLLADGSDDSIRLDLSTTGLRVSICRPEYNWPWRSFTAV